MTSETFSQTAGQIITNALRDARIIAAEQPIQAKDLIDGLQAINMIIKHWQTQGIHLWSEIEAVMALVPGQRKYLLGPDGDDVGTASTFFNTTLLSDVAASRDLFDGDITDSTDGWTTFLGGVVDVISEQLRLTNGAASAGQARFAFTTVTGSDYTITFDYTGGTAAAPIASVGDTTFGTVAGPISLTAVGTFELEFTALSTSSLFVLSTGSGVLGETALIDNFVATATILTVDLTATSGNTTDGQAISVQGAPDIFASDPTDSTQDWTTINSGVIATVATGLELTNGAGVAGGAEFTLDTTIGVDYRVDISYEVGTAASAVFTVEDTTGVLDTITLTATGTDSLKFTARDLTTTFRFENGSIVIGLDNVLASLNYRDKTAGDRIGIELDNGLRHWDDVVSVDSDTQVSLNNGVETEATAGNTVYTYATAIARPMRLLQSRFAETITATEIPVRQWSRDEYFDQPDKDSSGTVVNWYYTPTLNIGQLFVWQVANDINQVLRFTYVEPIEIPTDTDDSLDVPSEWYLPLKWAVAAELGPSRGISDNRQVILESKAAATLQEALDFDVERESLSLQPNFR